MQLLDKLLKLASRAPSGGNVSNGRRKNGFKFIINARGVALQVQPWLVHVVSGAARDALCDAVRENVKNGVITEGTEYDVYPPNLTQPYRGYRAKLGYALYDLAGVAKTDAEGRLKQLARNWDLFDAPVGVFLVMDRQMGPPQCTGMLLCFLMLETPQQTDAVFPRRAYYWK